MKVAIIGAGFGGLSAGYCLSKAGEDVIIFESSGQPGGLASGFTEKNWEWPLEQHYHHFFTSDKFVLDLAREVGQNINFRKPLSSTFLDEKILQLDSPISLLKFDKLSILDRLKTGSVIAFLKVNPFWKPLEKVTSYDFITKTMGIGSWNIIWKPLFEKKFGEYGREINAAWFWSRIKKRSAWLGYPDGGFLSFAKKIENEFYRYGGKIIYDTRVKSIEKIGSKFSIDTVNKKEVYNKVICTLPSKLFLQIAKNLPKEYVGKLFGLKGIGAINLVLSLKDKFLKDGSYWLNVNESPFPFLALVEHTNFIDKKYYNGEHLLYIANYLPENHKYFSYSEKDLLEEFLPYLRKINKDFNKSQVNKAWVFKAAFAQPITNRNHSESIPSIETPIKNLFIANMQQVYPWDRGTNYAVELGQKVAELVLKS